MELVEQVATFTVNIIGRHSKSSYMGTFKVKCLLSPLEEIAADKRYRDLLGSNSHLAQERVRQQAFALAQLEQRIIAMPPFWENDTLPGGHISDDNVLLHVLDEAIEAQNKYIQGKEDELKERQQRLTKAIKKKKIEKEPELDEVQVKDPNEPDEVEID
jgi:hypothetical protein